MTAGGDWLPPIPWKVIRARCLTPSQGRVLFVLWSRCNAAGDCWPSLATVAEDSGTDRRTAIRAAAVLEQQGIVSVDRIPGHGNRYHLDPAGICAFVEAHTDPLEAPTSDKMSPVTKSHPWQIVTTPVTKSHPTSDKNEVGRGDFLSPKEEPLKKNQEEEPLKKSQGRAAPRQPARKKKSVAEVTAELIALYADIWPAVEVEERIAVALNHKASDKWKDPALGLKNWLRRDAATEGAKGAYTNGTQAAPAGQRTGTGAGLSWDERHAHVRPPAEPDDLSRFD